MNKTQKPAGFQLMVEPAQKPLTEEEKKVKIMQFLQQKRETISVNVLCNLVHGAITNRDVTNMQCKFLVDLSVEMADALMEKIYPLPKEEKPKEDKE